MESCPSRLIQLCHHLSNSRLFFVLWYVLWFWKSETELSPNQEKKEKKKKSYKLVLIMLNVWLLMLTQLFNTSWQTEGSKWDSGYLLRLIQIQGDICLLQGTSWGSQGQKSEARSLSENGHSSDCQNVLGSVVRCMANQVPFLQTRLWPSFPLNDAGSVWCACLSKISISSHILVEFKVVLKYIQQYSQHLVHLIFIIKQSTKKIQLYLNLLISVSYDDQKSESFCV